MISLRNAIAMTVLSTSAVVSLVCLIFCFYMLAAANDSTLYVSLASGIISFWLGVSSSFIKLVGAEESTVPALPV